MAKAEMGEYNRLRVFNDPPSYIRKLLDEDTQVAMNALKIFDAKSLKMIELYNASPFSLLRRNPKPCANKNVTSTCL